MKTWTDTTFTMDETDNPTVTTHTDSVSLHLSGYGRDDRGFSLRFLPAHLPRLRELCAALETLTAETTHTDHNPFHHDDGCPACQHEAAQEAAANDADAGREYEAMLVDPSRVTRGDTEQVDEA